MDSIILNISPLSGAIICSIFTFLLTSLGASVVFFFKKINNDLLDYMVALSAGIMLAASFFSLLDPAINLSYELNFKPYIVCSLGFLLGGLFLYISDKIINKKIKIKNNKSLIMLIFSITLHNIPEGASIGVAFGLLCYNYSYSALLSAFILALGIGIQNFPEGSAVSLPLKASGYSSFKSFIIGSLTALVEPISAIIGVILAMKIKIIMPILLSFASAAMIYVIATELLPETNEKNKSKVGLITIIGFIIMMFLDIALS